MSESAVKAARRDLRRTLGAEGLSVVQQTQTNIGQLSQSLGNAHSRIDHTNAKIDDRWLQTAAALKAMRTRIDDLESRTLGARLRRLVFWR